MGRQRHEVEHHHENGASVGVLIEHGNRFHCVEALVDGGSARSLLPYSAVSVLGLEGTLRRPRLIRLAGGARARAWRTSAPLNARLAELVNDEPRHFGPEVRLDPWFVKAPRRLLGAAAPAPRPLVGRQDFLSNFDYSVTGDRLTLEWED